MSIFGMMRTATSGMNAQSNRLGTVADNIANSSTAGYKRASTEFSSLVLESGSGEYNSGSVETRSALRHQRSRAASTSRPRRPISPSAATASWSSSEGTDAGAATHLTRAGSFVKDGDGYLVNSAGYYLMGVPWTNQNATPTIPPTAPRASRRCRSRRWRCRPCRRRPARSTSTCRRRLRSMRRRFRRTTLATSGRTRPRARSSSSTISARKVTLDVYSSKTGTAPDTWEMTVFDQADADRDDRLPLHRRYGPLSTRDAHVRSRHGKLDSTVPARPRSRITGAERRLARPRHGRDDAARDHVPGARAEGRRQRAERGRSRRDRRHGHALCRLRERPARKEVL